MTIATATKRTMVQPCPIPTAGKILQVPVPEDISSWKPFYEILRFQIDRKRMVASHEDWGRLIGDIHLRIYTKGNKYSKLKIAIDAEVEPDIWTASAKRDVIVRLREIEYPLLPDHFKENP